MGIIYFLLAVLFVVILIKAIMCINDYWDDEVVTTTTTTTTTTNNVNYDRPIHGLLKRQWDGQQPYVVDPVDGERWYLNTTDDLYEDANGKWWTLS